LRCRLNHEDIIHGYYMINIWIIWDIYIYTIIWVNFITTSRRDLTGMMINKENHPLLWP
jgi:hypothetical protein